MEMVIFEPWVKNTLDSIGYKMPDLRDLFAMNAINGILASPDFTGTPEVLTENAYQYADAMLQARKKKS